MTTTTTTSARRTIIGAMAVTGGVATIRTIRTGPTPLVDALPRILAGSFIAAALLSLLAGPAPGIAAGLALITAIAATITAGPATFTIFE